MATVTATIHTVQKDPGTQTFAEFQVRLLISGNGNDAVPFVRTTDTVAVFNAVPDGTYIVQVTDMDTTGNNIGPRVQSAPFAVGSAPPPPPPGPYQGASTVTVVVS